MTSREADPPDRVRGQRARRGARSRPSSRCCAAARPRCASGGTCGRSSRASPSCSASGAGSWCNSGSSALYLAVELLGLRARRRGHHLGGDVLDRHRARSCGPASCPRSSTSSRTRTTSTSTRIEAMIGPRTKAILAPNLIGNCPDWDRIRAIADRHGLQVIEDSCDALGATLRGTPTGTRVRHQRHQLRPLAHHHRRRHRRDGAARRRRARRPLPAAAPVGPTLRGPALRLDEGRQALLLRDRRRLEYDNLFIFDEVGWNFEPSRALRRVRRWCSCGKLPQNLARRQRNFDLLSSVFAHLPRRVRAAAPARRARDRVAHVPDHAPARVGHPPGRASRSTWRRTASTPAWCGPATSLRQPAFAERAAPRPRGWAARTPTG